VSLVIGSGMIGSTFPVPESGGADMSPIEKGENG
jgi:hypothetical protein